MHESSCNKIESILRDPTSPVLNNSNKTLTRSNVARGVADDVGLIPKSSSWTRVLSARCVLRNGIPDATLDVFPRAIMFIVVAVVVHYDEKISTRVGQTAAISSSYNAHSQNGFSLASSNTEYFRGVGTAVATATLAPQC